MKVYAHDAHVKCIYVTLCVFEGEWEWGGEKEGFIVLFFYARDHMNLSVWVCVCVSEWM